MVVSVSPSLKRVPSARRDAADQQALGPPASSECAPLGGDVVPLGELPRPTHLAACARHLRARFELNRGYVTEIGMLTGLPIVCLPYLAQGIEGPAEIETLADTLLEPPRSAAA